MSRNHAVLAASLVVVVGMVGIAQASMSDGSSPSPIAVAAQGAPIVAPEPTTAPVSPAGAASDEERDDVPDVDPECTLSMRLQVGITDPEVACLETRLAAAGVLTGVVPDHEFDATTEAAVEAFQTANALHVDGIVGPQTADRLGTWIGPDLMPPDPDTCPDGGRAAVVDRFNQRAWLCEDGAITDEMPITTAVSQPDPGTYEVYAKDMHASSSFSGEYSTMTHFVAFTYGKFQGARIAFHSVPTYPGGEYVQPLDTVGSPEQYGDSSGCIRVLPDDARVIWDWLDVGDTVVVAT